MNIRKHFLSWAEKGRVQPDKRKIETDRGAFLLRRMKRWSRKIKSPIVSHKIKRLHINKVGKGN